MVPDEILKFFALKRNTILDPIYQGFDLCGIDGNTDSLPSPYVQKTEGGGQQEKKTV